jgi:hypothetical protein
MREWKWLQWQAGSSSILNLRDRLRVVMWYVCISMPVTMDPNYISSSIGIGALLPIMAARTKRMRVPPLAFFITKYFGSGVIIATAFIHVSIFDLIVGTFGCTFDTYFLVSLRPLHFEIWILTYLSSLHLQQTP